ncbi:MAG: hypothetical protein ACI81O_001050 [Cyclobacteriaceae bacterium]|jgi:hypothetical protein
MSDNMTELLGAIQHPATIIEALLTAVNERRVSFNFAFQTYYELEPVTYQLYCECWRADNDLYCRVSRDPASMPVGVVNLSRPLRLEPVTIAKPWGEEIWYTGIEARGVCTVEGIPLPWLIALSPRWILGGEYRDPILLKILAPLKQARYGDLYLELHEHKIEVYVVTQIDREAWPDGKGQIRFGFNPAMIDAFPTEAAFRRAYLACVNDYQRIRHRVDAQLDDIRSAQGYLPNAVVAPDILEQWRQQLDKGLNTEEAQQLATMNTFTALHDVSVGSVIQVKPFTPHSLQHGVRVIEFQSPHYERFILSFAQKVLTQSHWDTDTAIARAHLHAEMAPTLVSITHQEGCSVDQIVNFAEFEVHSLRLEPGARHTLNIVQYAVLMGVEGTADVGQQTIKSEQAVLLTALSGSQTLLNQSDQGAVVLLAMPVLK